MYFVDSVHQKRFWIHQSLCAEKKIIVCRHINADTIDEMFPLRSVSHISDIITLLTLSKQLAASADTMAIGCLACLDRSAVRVLSNLASSAVLPFWLNNSSGPRSLFMIEFIDVHPKTN